MNTRAATLDTSIEDALSHRSGLPRHDHVYGSRDRNGKDSYTIKDLLKALPHLSLSAQARTQYQYCNIMYMLASNVVEVVSGLSFEAFVHQRLLEPLGMSSTYLSLETAQSAVKEKGQHFAHGCFWDDENQEYVREARMDSQVVSGAAHMISNVLDFAKYLKAMIDESPPISKKGYEELRAPRSIQPPPKYGGPYAGPLTYTLGWNYTVYNGESLFFHGGGVPGFGTLMCYIPKKRWGVAMMANTEIRSNAMQEIIWHKLMDDRLSVPKEKQFNFEKYWERRHKEDYIDKFFNSPKRLYPDAVWSGPPSDLQFPDDFVGDFEHPGYGTLTVSIASPKRRYPGAKAGPMLRTDTKDRAWPFQLQFQPVNGLHFLAWKLPLDGNPVMLFKGALKAEFRLDARGDVDMLGIAWDDEMEDEKIWFERKRSEG